jgi:hypothetical protein
MIARAKAIRMTAFFMVVSLFDGVSMPGRRRLGCD